MIKEVIENRIASYYDMIVDGIVDYFGSEYEDEIKRMVNDVSIFLVKDNGVYSYDNNEVYVGDEPIYFRDREKSYIVIPFSIASQSCGNVAFVHVLLHSLGKEPFIRENKRAFNEVVVDYMASQISKNLELSGVNITLVDKPVYESHSFYSMMFDDVEEFCENNMQKIIDYRMGKNVEFDEGEVDEYIDGAEMIVDKAFLGEEENINFEIKRR